MGHWLVAVYVFEDVGDCFFLVFGWGELKVFFHKVVCFFCVHREVVCLCGEAGVFCDVLRDLECEGLLKCESFFCRFIFVLCGWFVYVDECIVATWEIEAITHFFWDGVFHVFDGIVCEHFFYIGAEPERRDTFCFRVDGDEFSAGICTIIIIIITVIDAEYVVCLFACLLDDWVGEVQLALSGHFSGYFHDVSLVVLVCYVGLIEPYCSDFLCACVDGCFSDHHPSFAAGAAHIDFFYGAGEGYFLPFGEGAVKHFCSVGVAAREVVEEVVDGFYIEFFEGTEVGFFGGWEIVGEGGWVLHRYSITCGEVLHTAHFERPCMDLLVWYWVCR